MAGDYTRATATAQRLIASKGRSVTLISYTDRDPVSPQVPWRSAGTGAAEFEANALFVGQTKTSLDDKGVASSTIRESAEVLLSTSGLDDVAPEMNDEIVTGDDEFKWRIAEVEKVAPSGTAILYKLKVTR